ncbi:50S ribosomal protein L32 [bacterium]|nr:50S ribosomal protein L32 [bacterium]
MAVPKRRKSKSRSRQRRSHNALKEPNLSICPECQEPKLPHRVCKNCGYYGKTQVLELTKE